MLRGSRCSLWSNTGTTSDLDTHLWLSLLQSFCKSDVFHYDTTRGRATKRRYRVIPDPYIQFPVLDSGVRCRDVTLRLNSMVIHLGEAPTHGHYRSLLFDHLSCTYWLTDDGVAPVEMDSDRFQTFGSDVYLLIYQQ